jgi:hypothetical protein
LLLINSTVFLDFSLRFTAKLNMEDEMEVEVAAGIMAVDAEME